MLEAAGELSERIKRISCPTLILTSRNDHVVPPENSDLLAETVQGPVEREWYDRSYHVITLDYDKDAVEARVVEFAKRVTGQ
jgi:carboxylesterase